MKLEVTEGKWDEFTLDEDKFGYNKETKTFYPSYVSSKTYAFGNCLGRIHTILLNEKETDALVWFMPMFPRCGDYELFGKKQLETHRDIAEAFTKFKNE